MRLAAGAASGTIATVSGDVFAEDGRVSGTIRSVSGAIGLVRTEVTGDVRNYAGDVTIGIGSHVKGGLIVQKPDNQTIRITPVSTPRIIIGPGAKVDGVLDFRHPVRLQVHRSARIGEVKGAPPVYFDSPRAPQD